MAVGELDGETGLRIVVLRDLRAARLELAHRRRPAACLRRTSLALLRRLFTKNLQLRGAALQAAAGGGVRLEGGRARHVLRRANYRY